MHAHGTAVLHDQTLGETRKHSFGLLSMVDEPDPPVYNPKVSHYAYLDQETDNLSSDR